MILLTLCLGFSVSVASATAEIKIDGVIPEKGKWCFTNGPYLEGLSARSWRRHEHEMMATILEKIYRYRNVLRNSPLSEDNVTTLIDHDLSSVFIALNSIFSKYEELGLTLWEAIFVKGYTEGGAQGGIFETINRVLRVRTGVPTDVMEMVNIYKDNLINVLRKLGWQYRGQDLVFRGLRCAPYKSLRTDDVFEDTSFMSTSVLRHIAVDFMEKKTRTSKGECTLLKIYKAQGCRLDDRVSNGLEQEFLIPPRSRFRVISNTETSPGKWEIVAEMISTDAMTQGEQQLSMLKHSKQKYIENTKARAEKRRKVSPAGLEAQVYERKQEEEIEKMIRAWRAEFQ